MRRCVAHIASFRPALVLTPNWFGHFAAPRAAFCNSSSTSPLAVAKLAHARFHLHNYFWNTLMRTAINRRKFLAVSVLTFGRSGDSLGAEPERKTQHRGDRCGHRGAANLALVSSTRTSSRSAMWTPTTRRRPREEFPESGILHRLPPTLRQSRQEFRRGCGQHPDHNHALPACIAMTFGKHVYREKPMAETVNEVRHMRALPRSTKLPRKWVRRFTAGENYRRVVEIVQSGLLGEIKSVHVWNNSKPVGGKRLNAKPSAKFDLDVWMGPTKGEFFEAEMNKSNWNFAWPHFHWRWWWEFGGGALADLGCHYIDLPYWALDLTSPSKVTATGRVTYKGDNTTPDVMKVEYEFRRTAALGIFA